MSTSSGESAPSGEPRPSGEGLPGSDPVLTVAAVARRLGVAPSTLRTWDRRYGLGPSAHTAGSHRRYSPVDVNRLVVMRGLVMEGVPPAEAAAIALSCAAAAGPVGTPPGPQGRQIVAQPAVVAQYAPPDAALPKLGPAAAVPVTRDGTADRPPEWDRAAARSRLSFAPPAVTEALLVDRFVTGTPAGQVRQPTDPDPELSRDLDRALTEVVDQAIGAACELNRLSPAQAHAPQLPLQDGGDLPQWSSSSGRAGGGRVLSLPDAAPRTRGLARAVMALDSPEVTRLLREALAGYGVVGAWDSMVLPVLHSLGERWRLTGDGVEVEHAFCEAVVGVLRGVTGTLYRPRNTRPVLLACADGDQHGLPLHALAAALAEVGIGCRMLGVALPEHALLAAVRRTGPAVVFVYARMPVAAGDVLAQLPRQRPAPRILVGGPGWQSVELPSGVLSVPSLRVAVEQVTTAVLV